MQFFDWDTDNPGTSVHPSRLAEDVNSPLLKHVTAVALECFPLYLTGGNIVFIVSF